MKNTIISSGSVKTCKDCRYIKKNKVFKIFDEPNKKFESVKPKTEFYCNKNFCNLTNYDRCLNFKQRKKVIGHKRNFKNGLFFGVIIGGVYGVIFAFIVEALIFGLIMGIFVGLWVALAFGLDGEYIYDNSNIDEEDKNGE